MKTTTDGQGSYGDPLDDRDIADWLACFGPAIAGALSAQREIPNPRKIIKIANSVANEGLACIQSKRRKQ